MQKLGRTGSILGFLGPQSLGLGWAWVMRFRPRPRLGWVLGRDLRPKLGRAEVYIYYYRFIKDFTKIYILLYKLLKESNSILYKKYF